MSDSSWDNGGHGVPVKPGLPLWGKIAMGCGIAFLVVLVTCVGGMAYVANKFKKDPEGAKRWAMGLAADKLRPDWEDFRQVINQLRTPEGTQSLYATNPELARTWPKEADFLKDAEGWRKNLPEVPPLGPDMLEQHGISLHRELNGSVLVSWRPKEGPQVAVTFLSARKSGAPSQRQVTSIEIH